MLCNVILFVVNGFTKEFSQFRCYVWEMKKLGLFWRKWSMKLFKFMQNLVLDFFTWVQMKCFRWLHHSYFFLCLNFWIILSYYFVILLSLYKSMLIKLKQFCSYIYAYCLECYRLDIAMKHKEKYKSLDQERN